MRPADKIEFVKIINGLQSIKPGQKLTADGIEMFWLAMQSWPLDDFKAAAAYLASSVEFMPNPYHFNQLRRAGELTSGEAWDAAISYCRKSCAGDSPGGRVDRAAQAVGGYATIGHANQETQLPHVERRFKEAYDELDNVEVVRHALPQITSVNQLERLAGENSERQRLTA